MSKKCPHLPRLLALLAVALAAGVIVAVIVASPSSAHGKRTTERLVVRGTDTVQDDQCPGGVCTLTLAGGSFHGTPVGEGAYTGTLRFKFAETFPNGEKGICAPIAGTITLGEGTPDRLVLAVAGDSCQDGAGNPATSSFTNLARWAVKSGTGAYAKARGYGLMTSVEGADDVEHMTLIGRITR